MPEFLQFWQMPVRIPKLKSLFSQQQEDILVVEMTWEIWLQDGKSTTYAKMFTVLTDLDFALR